ncbi:MAG: serine acetyltransferase [Flavobacterium sp.]|nr:serine acetyltransferase [Flavobacterium sp.]
MTKTALREDLQQDLLRYGIRQPFSIRLFFKCFGPNYAPGLKFIFLCRFCKYYKSRSRLLFYFLMIWLRHLTNKYGIDISYRTKIGKGLYIGHFGGIVVHGDAEIGENCNLSQGVTIGVLIRGKKTGVPKIGNRCFLGPGATILGGVTIGDDVLIGANAIVTFDVPSNSVVASPLASIVSNKGSKEYIVNIK